MTAEKKKHPQTLNSSLDWEGGKKKKSGKKTKPSIEHSQQIIEASSAAVVLVFAKISCAVCSNLNLDSSLIFFFFSLVFLLALPSS